MEQKSIPLRYYRYFQGGGSTATIDIQLIQFDFVIPIAAISIRLIKFNIKTPLEVLLRKLVVNWCIVTHKYYLT